MRVKPRLLYMAHPVSGDVAANLERAKRWLRWLYLAYPHDVVIAPWLLDLEVLPLRDEDPEARERGLVRDEVAVRHCDAIVLVGGKVTRGMNRESAVALEAGLEVLNLVHLGDEPPKRRHA